MRKSSFPSDGIRNRSLSEMHRDFRPSRSVGVLLLSLKTSLTGIVGSHNCVGKRLAMAQLRSVVKVVVSSFEIGFAPGEDKNSVWENLKDQFNAHPGKLHLVFSVRNSK